MLVCIFSLTFEIYTFILNDKRLRGKQWPTGVEEEKGALDGQN